MRFAVVAHAPSATNLALAARGWNGIPGELLAPRAALLALGRGDVALARLDVRRSLDGVEDGLWALERLAEAGVTVLNPPSPLLPAHAHCLRPSPVNSHPRARCPIRPIPASSGPRPSRTPPPRPPPTRAPAAGAPTSSPAAPALSSRPRSAASRTASGSARRAPSRRS